VPANVDENDGLLQTLRAIGTGCRDKKVVFPVHPRTAKTLKKLGDLPGNIRLGGASALS